MNGSCAAVVTPEELLAAADQLLASPVPGAGAQWPRACALLIRLALEMTLDWFWARVLPVAAGCGMRQQLLLLPLYTVDLPAAAGLTRETWLGLAGAAHHHAYELAPTAPELRTWHTKVTELAALLLQPEHQSPNLALQHCCPRIAGQQGQTGCKRINP